MAVDLEGIVLVMKVYILEAIVIMIIFIILNLVLSHILEVVLRLCGTMIFTGSYNKILAITLRESSISGTFENVSLSQVNLFSLENSIGFLEVFYAK